MNSLINTEVHQYLYTLIFLELKKNQFQEYGTVWLMILSIQYVFRNYTSIDFRFTDQLNNETQDN